MVLARSEGREAQRCAARAIGSLLEDGFSARPFLACNGAEALVVLAQVPEHRGGSSRIVSVWTGLDRIA